MLLKRTSNSGHETGRDLAAVMARVYGPCRACGASTIDHHVWEFASASPWDPHSQLAYLDAFIARRDWKAASKIHESRGTDDAVVYVFLRCPESNGMSLMRLESSRELWADDRVTDRWVLNDDEVRAANEAAGGAWRRVGEHDPRPEATSPGCTDRATGGR